MGGVLRNKKNILNTFVKGGGEGVVRAREFSKEHEEIEELLTHSAHRGRG